MDWVGGNKQRLLCRCQSNQAFTSPTFQIAGSLCPKMLESSQSINPPIFATHLARIWQNKPSLAQPNFNHIISDYIRKRKNRCRSQNKKHASSATHNFKYRKKRFETIIGRTFKKKIGKERRCQDETIAQSHCITQSSDWISTTRVRFDRRDRERRESAVSFDAFFVFFFVSFGFALFGRNAFFFSRDLRFFSVRASLSKLKMFWDNWWV